MEISKIFIPFVLGLLLAVGAYKYFGVPSILGDPGEWGRGSDIGIRMERPFALVSDAGQSICEGSVTVRNHGSRPIYVAFSIVPRAGGARHDNGGFYSRASFRRASATINGAGDAPSSDGPPQDYSPGVADPGTGDLGSSDYGGSGGGFGGSGGGGYSGGSSYGGGGSNSIDMSSPGGDYSGNDSSNRPAVVANGEVAVEVQAGASADQPVNVAFNQGGGGGGDYYGGGGGQGMPEPDCNSLNQPDALTFTLEECREQESTGVSDCKDEVKAHF